MITAKDLRHGLILQYFRGMEDVWETRPVDWRGIKHCTERPEDFNKNWRPIPLSEKVLLACGFEKKGTTLSYVISFHKFNVILKKVEYNKGYHFELELIGKLKRIESLHALQNFIFALTGTELTIDINKLEL